MIEKNKAPAWNATGQADIVQATANLHVVSDGEVYRNNSVQQVMVESEEDLALLSDYDYPPGVIAFTAGYERVWQKDADGEWVTVV